MSRSGASGAGGGNSYVHGLGLAGQGHDGGVATGAPSYATGGDGGSGIVILRYLTP